MDPGPYTAIVSGKSDGVGAALVEIYDISLARPTQLGNISTRSFVDVGDNVMIGGFIAGPADGGLVTVLIRAIGPSLTAFGVPSVLDDPILSLHDGNGIGLATNDDWQTNENGASQQADIEATGLPPGNARESAILTALAPGSYTAIVRGKGGTTGVALVEVFKVR